MQISLVIDLTLTEKVVVLIIINKNKNYVQSLDDPESLRFVTTK